MKEFISLIILFFAVISTYAIAKEPSSSTYSGCDETYYISGKPINGDSNGENSRCCTADINPIWWCTEGSRINTQTECTFGNTKKIPGVVWTCKNDVKDEVSCKEEAVDSRTDENLLSQIEKINKITEDIVNKTEDPVPAEFASKPWHELEACKDFGSQAIAGVRQRAGQNDPKFHEAILCIGHYESTCQGDVTGTHSGVRYAGGFQFNKKAWRACFSHFKEQMDGCSILWPEGAKDVGCAAACTAMHVIFTGADTQFETVGTKRNPGKCNKLVNDVVNQNPGKGKKK